MRFSLKGGKHGYRANAERKNNNEDRGDGMPGFGAILEGLDEDFVADHGPDESSHAESHQIPRKFWQRSKLVSGRAIGVTSGRRKSKGEDLHDNYTETLPTEDTSGSDSDGAAREGSRKRFINSQFKVPLGKAIEPVGISRTTVEKVNAVGKESSEHQDPDEISNVDMEAQVPTKFLQRRKFVSRDANGATSRKRKSKDDDLDDDYLETKFPTVDMQVGISDGAIWEGSRRTFMNSQFKAPTGRAPGPLGLSRNSADIVDACPRFFRTPYQPPKYLALGESGVESNTKMEAVKLEHYVVMYCPWKPYTKRKGPWSDGILIRSGRSFVLQDADGKLVSKDGDSQSGELSAGDILQMGKFEVEVMNRSESEEPVGGGSLGRTIEPRAEIVDYARRPVFKGFRAPAFANERLAVAAQSLIQPEIPRQEASLQERDLVLHSEISRGGVSVVVDPHLSLKLRPHQREGVKFLYECVMGLRNPRFTGCLLADAMGLGKTLQVITLIWTLLKQASSKQGAWQKPIVKRVLVVCPSSLVENWGNEIRKWLGKERLTPLIVHSGTSAKDVKRKISNFQIGTVYNLLVTSYEVFRKHKDDLKSANPGLLICDEAHRLKNCAGNKTIDALMALKCSKRIILTGTPIQNDLLEFYAMIDFVNPTLLGPLVPFKREYATPIEKSRDRDASELEKSLGSIRSEELQSMTEFCILQRSADVISKYLSKKTEYVVFCKLQSTQILIYEDFLNSKLVCDSLASGQSAMALSAILTLRKLCNHPKLTDYDLSKRSGQLTIGRSLPSTIPGRYCGREDWRLSGKLCCLHTILSAVHDEAQCTSKDKTVVVSNFTSTLDIIQTLCQGRGWRWLRLDGATNVSERQALVDRFNTKYHETVFLLSAKAGGSGLNLIGGNRLILFDPDWNPATDAQAMARIWRDGQTKDVYIYRLLTTGSIEEKIYQRQIVKGEVAAAVKGRGTGSSGQHATGQRHFSREELRELFSLNTETRCDTYDLLSQAQSPGSKCWEDCSKEVEDLALKEAIQTQVVTFVYQSVTKEILPPVKDACREEEFTLEGEDTHREDAELVSGGETGSNVSPSKLPSVSADGIESSLDHQTSFLASETRKYHETLPSLESKFLSTKNFEVTTSTQENSFDEHPRIDNCGSSAFDVTEMDAILLEYNEQMSPREQNKMDSLESKSGSRKVFRSSAPNHGEERCILEKIDSPACCNEEDVSGDDSPLGREVHTCDPIRKEMKSLPDSFIDHGDVSTHCDIPEHDYPINVTLSSPPDLVIKSGPEEFESLHGIEHLAADITIPAVCRGRDNTTEKQVDLYVEGLRVRSSNDNLLHVPSMKPNEDQADRLSARGAPFGIHSSNYTALEKQNIEQCAHYLSDSCEIPRQHEHLSSGAVRTGTISPDDERPAELVSSGKSIVKDKIPEEIASDDESGALADSADTQPDVEAVNCLDETHTQNFLMLALADMKAPDDEFDVVSELEILDAPFLCGLHLEMEMTKANFGAEDLWHGFKAFTLGFLCGVKEHRLAYRRCKLGSLFERCTIDKTIDDESLFCKGFPLVRAALKSLGGNKSSDISLLLDKYIREYFQTSPTGRFLTGMSRLIDSTGSRDSFS